MDSMIAIRADGETVIIVDRENKKKRWRWLILEGDGSLRWVKPEDVTIKANATVHHWYIKDGKVYGGADII